MSELKARLVDLALGSNDLGKRDTFRDHICELMHRIVIFYYTHPDPDDPT